MKIFIIAGEESGDILGADLMASLQTKYKKHDFIFRGVGGARMEAESLNSLFPMRELSLMGITEILPKVPHMLKRIRQTADAIETFQPDILITIDSPDFSFRVAKAVQKRGVNVPLKVHYVAPTVWAWRPKRAEKVAKLYDAIFCLFPFEPPYFEKEGMKALFVGHPMSALLKGVSAAAFIKQHKLSKSAQKIGIFFGSRRGEVARMGPVFVEALQGFLDQNVQGDNVVLICPTLPHLKAQVEGLLENLACQKIIITDKEDKYPAMKACDIALATSGTVGLELSVLDVPHMIGYRVNALTHQIAKRLITTKYAHLSNILLQKPIVPEFIQDECTVENLSRSLCDLTQNDPSYDMQLKAFKEVRGMIRGADKFSPSDACAVFLMQNINASS